VRVMKRRYVSSKTQEPNTIDRLVSEVLGLLHLKLLITLPTPTNVSIPSYGRDERVQCVPLQPLTDVESKQFLRACSQPLDWEMQDWRWKQGWVRAERSAEACFSTRRVARRDCSRPAP